MTHTYLRLQKEFGKHPNHREMKEASRDFKAQVKAVEASKAQALLIEALKPKAGLEVEQCELELREELQEVLQEEEIEEELDLQQYAELDYEAELAAQALTEEPPHIDVPDQQEDEEDIVAGHFAREAAAEVQSQIEGQAYLESAIEESISRARQSLFFNFPGEGDDDAFYYSKKPGSYDDLSPIIVPTMGRKR